MSESPSTPPPENSPSTPADKPKKDWRKRWRKIILVVLIVLISVRLILFFAVGFVIRKVASGYGLNLDYDRQELTLTGGDVGLWGLRIGSQDGSQPFMQTEYIRGNISTLDLLKGNLVVRRAEADGVTLMLERTANGEIPILKQLLEHVSQPTPAEAKSTTAVSEIDFTPPLKIEALRLQHVRATIRDAAVTPSLQATVSMDIRVSDLGDKERPMRFNIDGWSDPVLDSLRITGQGTSAGRSLDALATVSVRGFHPKTLAGYLEPLGINPVGENVGADLSVNVRTDPLPEPSKSARGSITLNELSVVTDNVQTASLTTLKISLDSFDTQSMVVGNVNIKGGRVLATRQPEGLPQFAGLALGGAAPKKKSPTTQPVEIAAIPKPTTRQSLAAATGQPAFSLIVRSVQIEDIIAGFHDTALAPANDVKFIVNNITFGGKDGTATGKESALPLEGKITSPGLFNTLVFKGTASPTNLAKALDLNFTVDDIRPAALRPYLAMIGVDSLYKSGAAQAHLTAAFHDDPAKGTQANVDITDIKLTDGNDLFAIPEIKITGAGLDLQTGRLKIDSLTGSGPAIEISRDAQGRVSVLNFRWTPPGPQAPTTQPAVAEPIELPVITVASVPRVEVGHLKWDGVKIRMKDDGFKPPSELSVGDAGVEINNFIFDLAAEQASKPGSLRVWLTSPQLLKTFNIDGTFTPAAGSFTTDLQVRGSGMQTSALGPYLKTIGIEPSLKDGSVAADVHVNMKNAAGLVATSLDVSNAKIADGQNSLASVKNLQVDSLTFGPDGMAAKSIVVAEPQLSIGRDVDSALAALGLRILPGAAPAAAPSVEPPTDPLAIQFPKVSVKKIDVNSAFITWDDRFFESPVKSALHVQFNAQDFSLGKPAKAAPFKCVLTADEITGPILITGELDTTPDAMYVKAVAQGTKIHGRALKSYLPAGMEVSARDGEVVAPIYAELKKNDAGGKSLRFTTGKIIWADSETKSIFLTIDSVNAIASRIDVPGNVIAVDEISVNGIETDATIENGGIISALGITIKPVPPGAIPTKKPIAQMPTDASAPSTAPPEDVTKLIVAARRPLPNITLNKLDLNLRRATLHDLSRENAKPLSVENVHLVNTTKVEMGGADPNANPPVKLSLTGNISPVVKKFSVGTTMTPMATEPAATIDVAVTGIRGEGVTELLPELAGKLDGSQMTDGQLTSQIQLNMKFDKRGPRDFDLSRGFSLETIVNGIQFRDRPNGDVLAGLESIRAEKILVKPQQGSVIARSVEITKPSARIFREADGIRAFGFVIPLKSQPTTQPTEESTVAQAPPPKPAVKPAPETPSEKPAGEIAIQKLTVSGADIVIADHSVNPQMVLPINGLDVEVRDITTLALTEEKFIRFNAIVNADKVELPIPPKHNGGGIPASLGGKADEPEASASQMEQRDLFTQATATGRLALYPLPHGAVRASINGLELLAFKGLASEQKVEIYRGIFDGDVNASLRENGDVDTNLQLAINDLKVSEPGGGFFQTFFQLPATLDAVIYGLEDVNRSVNIPLHVQMEQGSLSNSAIYNAVIGATGPLMLDAAKNAPLKAAREIAALAGLDLFASKSSGPAPVIIDFAPGSTNLDPQSAAKLQDMIDRVARDSSKQLSLANQLGGGDVPLVTARANPSPQDCAAMAAQLRNRRNTLLAERDRLAGEVRGQLATIAAEKSEPSVDRLRAIDREIAGTEQAMDQLYDLLKPGADRQAPRRTRAAGIQLGQERLNEIRDLVLRGLDPDQTDQVNVYTPQFNPTETNEGGRVVVTLITKKKS